MGNSLRCCLACVLPCGALDVVRIVHLNGLVEEFSCQITAAQILEANPNHVITKPCSASGGGAKRIGIVSPESELKRGNIYFLIPSASVPEKKQKKKQKEQKIKKHPKKPTAKVTSSVDDDNYLRELLSEKRSSHRRRRSVRVAVWRPQLESIKEE